MRVAEENTMTTLSSAREQAGVVSRRAQDSLSNSMEQHPMVVGGVGLLIGALIAAAIPTSRAENRLWGDTSDDLKDRVRDVVSHGYETAKTAAEDVYQAGKHAAQDLSVSTGAVRPERAGSEDEAATDQTGLGSISRQSSGGTQVK
jgi:hypothetical protein